VSNRAVELPIFAEGIVGFGPPPAASPYLVGGHCSSCDRWYFPRVDRCRHCHVTLEPGSLGSRGTVYSYTIVRTKPPLGLPQPYAVAYVDLADRPLRIFMLTDPVKTDDIAIGQAVELAVTPLGVNRHGEPCRRPYFKPVTPPRIR
jgi:uncharacterized OB-fold protein